MPKAPPKTKTEQIKEPQQPLPKTPTATSSAPKTPKKSSNGVPQPSSSASPAGKSKSGPKPSKTKASSNKPLVEEGSRKFETHSDKGQPLAVVEDKIAEEAAHRKVVYEHYKTAICTADSSKLREGAKSAPLTADKAKDLLGWAEESENVKFGSDYLFVDRNNNKVRCWHNTRNRPFNTANALALMWEILGRPGQGINPNTGLGGNWQMNGEAMIIGRTGITLNCQHRLVALVWAAQEWAKRPLDFKEGWPREPVMECFFTFGIREDSATVNTIDTAKGRTLADALYACGLFSGQDKRQMKTLCRYLDYAVRLLWVRTGAQQAAVAYAPKRSHAESLEFINAHPRVLDCVKHIHEEEGKDGAISRYLPCGTASGMLYLMGASATDRDPPTKDGYANADSPSEMQVAWDNWDRACEFWVLLAQRDKALHALIELLGDKVEGDHVERLSQAEKCALISKAWQQHVAHPKKPLTEDELALEYKTDQETQLPVLAECPTCGGIDIGTT